MAYINHLPLLLQYHPVSSTAPLLIVATVLLAILTHYLLSVREETKLPFSQIIWNVLVRAMIPIPFTSPPCDSAQPTKKPSSSQQHAAKSVVLRNVFKLDKLQSVIRRGSATNPPGLGNWDNSCYQNSVLQSLASCKSFQTFLERVDELGMNDAPDLYITRFTTVDLQPEWVRIQRTVDMDAAKTQVNEQLAATGRTRVLFEDHQRG